MVAPRCQQRRTQERHRSFPQESHEEQLPSPQAVERAGGSCDAAVGWGTLETETDPGLGPPLCRQVSSCKPIQPTSSSWPSPPPLDAFRSPSDFQANLFDDAAVQEATSVAPQRHPLPPPWSCSLGAALPCQAQNSQSQRLCPASQGYPRGSSPSCAAERAAMSKSNSCVILKSFKHLAASHFSRHSWPLQHSLKILHIISLCSTVSVALLQSGVHRLKEP